MPGAKNKAIAVMLGKRIRELRIQKGMSQQTLANISEVELSTINRIELGKATPSVSLLYSIADSLEISVQELLP